MNPLAWNFEIHQRMRTLPRVAIGVLPIGLMFGSFVPLFVFVSSLSSILGIPENAPLRDQPNGMLWFIIFLVVMVVLMIAGYLLGWILNAFVLRIFFKWSQGQISRALLYSEIPASWLKETIAITGAASSSMSTITWAVTRQKGKARFIFQRGVFAWGIPMYLFMAVLPVINGRVEATTFYFLWQGCLWSAAGALFGFVNWYFSEKSFTKQHGKQ